MPDKIISHIIVETCKREGINYKSCNSNYDYDSLINDVPKMAKVYLQLKEIIGILIEIEDRHNLNGIREKFEKVIEELNDADHLLIKLAREIK
jgi:hypothetical protein